MGLLSAATAAAASAASSTAPAAGRVSARAAEDSTAEPAAADDDGDVLEGGDNNDGDNVGAQASLEEKLMTQIEFYFSDGNYRHDQFLRSSGKYTHLNFLPNAFNTRTECVRHDVWAGNHDHTSAWRRVIVLTAASPLLLCVHVQRTTNDGSR